MTEYLYLIGCVEKFYKIGKASNLQERLSQLQTGNPYRLRIFIAYGFPNATIIERCLHQRFADKRSNGEWFELSGKDLGDFSQLCEMLGGTVVEVQSGKKNLKRGRPKSNLWRMEFVNDNGRVRAMLRMGSAFDRKHLNMGTIEDVYKLDGYWRARCMEYCYRTGYQMKAEQ
jgi:hypothetical protein